MISRNILTLVWPGIALAGAMLTACNSEEKSPVADSSVSKPKSETPVLANKNAQADRTALESEMRALEKRKLEYASTLAKPGALSKAASGGAWIELPPKDKNADCQMKFFLHFDDEDNGNSNQYFAGYIDGNGNAIRTDYSQYNITVGGMEQVKGESGRAGGNTTMSFCQEYVSELPAAKWDYAVMAGSATCPTGSYKFIRHFDNQDYHNTNATSDEGLAYPNWASQYRSGFTDEGLSEITFCFVPGDASAPDYPPFGFDADKYMIFTRHRYAWFYEKKTDDEDDNNSNSWIDVDNSGYLSRMNQIVSAGPDTWVYFGANGSKPVQSFDRQSSCGSEPTQPSCSPGSSNSCNITWYNYSMAENNWRDCMGL